MYVMRDSHFLEGGTEDGGVYIVKASLDVKEKSEDLKTRGLKSPDCVHE